MSALWASGVMSPIRSAKAPTKAAPDAVSAAVKRAPACWEPTWFLSSPRSGRTAVASPSARLVTSTPRKPTKGTAWVIPCAIASKSFTGGPYPATRVDGLKTGPCPPKLAVGRHLAALEPGVPGAAVLEEGADGVLQILGGEEVGRFGAD